MNKNPLRYEYTARDFPLYVIINQVSMVPLSWLSYCGGKELLVRDSIESEVSMTYDIVCSETDRIITVLY